MKFVRVLLMVCAPLCLIGCASSRTYDVTVHNNTQSTLTLWLTKDGGEPEKGWYTPEEFLAAPPDEPSPGIQLEPGKIADTGPVKGHFPSSVHAILSVSRSGEKHPTGHPLILHVAPGKNEFDVRESAGKLQVFNPIASDPPIATEP
jgi:hypothetical protein